MLKRIYQIHLLTFFLYSTYSSPKISRRASSSGKICKKLRRKINAITITTPNQVPKKIVAAIVNKTSPKYMGFLEKRYIHSVTSAVVSEGVKGLMVVLCFANNRKEGMAHDKPITTTNILITV